MTECPQHLTLLVLSNISVYKKLADSFFLMGRRKKFMWKRSTNDTLVFCKTLVARVCTVKQSAFTLGSGDICNLSQQSSQLKNGEVGNLSSMSLHLVCFFSWLILSLVMACGIFALFLYKYAFRMHLEGSLLLFYPDLSALVTGETGGNLWCIHTLTCWAMTLTLPWCS